jgi:hypothetical protein
MPLAFLAQIATSSLPCIVTDRSSIGLLRQCAEAGYLAFAPLAVRGGDVPQLVAARVLAVLPEGKRALSFLDSGWNTIGVKAVAGSLC